MKKRKSFIIASLVVGLAFGGAHLFSFLWQTYTFWLGGFLLSILVLVVVYLLFFTYLSSWRETLTVAILPCLLALSFSWFAPLLPESFVWRAILFLIFAFGYYLVLLTENLFVVSYKFKTVPLYRAAFTTSFSFTLLIGFFLFSAIFSLKFSPWVNGLLTSTVGFFLFYHLFWSVSIAETTKQNFSLHALIASFLIGEMALVISFWPLTTSLSASYLVSCFYVLGSVFQHHLRERLFIKTLREYIVIGIGAFLALLFSAG